MQSELDLQLSRLMRAPRAALWQAWSDPAHLKQWWCPKPWQTEVRAFDFRPGGAFHTFMSGPDGSSSSDNPGSFLDIQPLERIVITSCLLADGRPAPTPWMPMTAIFSFADEGAGTRYAALVMHATPEARSQHEAMGFREGWGICFEQLDEYALTLV